MRILRTLILLGAAGLFLPSPPDDTSSPEAGAEGPSAFEMMSSAGATAADAASFCSRQPEVCAVGGYLAGQLERKLLYSASLLWGWAWEETPSSTGAGGTGGVIIMSVAGDVPGPPPTNASNPQAQGNSTLRLDDLIPEWRGPLPKKDG